MARLRHMNPEELRFSEQQLQQLRGTHRRLGRLNRTVLMHLRQIRFEYQDLYAALREHYQPLDILEELWVEKIAVWSWRLRRLLRCESGQIARALAEHSHEIKQSSAADSEELELPALSSLEIDSIIDHLFRPSKEELDKLLRYEAMINKQLNHALAELEKTAEAQERGIGSGADQRRHLPARLSILRNKANKSFIVSAAMYRDE